jgi:hypothetical protein
MVCRTVLTLIPSAQFSSCPFPEHCRSLCFFGGEGASAQEDEERRIEEQSMNRFEIGAHGFANLKTFISEKLSLSLEYRFGVGLNHIENDISDQKTRNIFHSALLGIGINI